MKLGRQLKPVMVIIEGGDQIDREHWYSRIRSFLSHQPCNTNLTGAGEKVMFAIYPDANND